MKYVITLAAALSLTTAVFAMPSPGLESQAAFKKYWQVEAESPDYTLSLSDGVCEISTPKGLTLWYREKMSGDVVIEYDAKVFDEREGDRLSDLNCFWMATDPAAKDVFKRLKERGGVFANASQMKLYYVGYGGNSNTTTRFRRYDGNPDPALVREYTDPEHLLKPGKWYHIKLVSAEGRVQYWLDGELLFDYFDSEPYDSGWFGFRTTWSRTAIRNFSYSATKPAPFSEAPLGWIGEAPAADKPVSFGVPFKKGEVLPGTVLQLQTAGGEAVDYDKWTMASWPDGSVKWLGMAAVIPGGTEGAKLVKLSTRKAPQAGPAMAEDLGESWKVATGAVTAFIPKNGNHIISGLYAGEVKVGGNATLVASEGGREYSGRIEKATLEQDGAVRTTIKLEGTHIGADGRSWLPFCVRLYFYKGSDRIGMVHSFVFDGDQDKDFISSIGIRFGVPMREQNYNRHIAFGTEDGGLWEEAVQPLHGRRVLTDPAPARGSNPAPAGPGGPGVRQPSWQARQVRGERVPEPEHFDAKGQFLIEKWANWDCYRLSQLTDNSYSIRKKAEPDRPWIGTLTGTRAPGFAFAGDVSGGIAVELKDFWQAYPATLEVKGARSEEAALEVWFWSPESEPMNLRHYDSVAHDLEASYEDVQEGMSTPYGIARTHSLTLVPVGDFPGLEGITALAAQMEQDPQLLPTPKYLHDVHAFGIWSLPDRSNPRRAAVEDRLDEYISLYQEHREKHKWYGFWNYGDFMHSMDDERGVWNYDIGGFAWDNTELASNMWLWYDFLRSGRRDIWDLAVAMTRHTTEVDVYHMGPYKGLGSRHNVSHWGCGAKEARIGQAAWNRFLYYLTTDERAGDLMIESKDSEQLLYELDPMRLAAPREKNPCTAPARLRFGPDWIGYAGNWMTQWERFGEKHYYDMIINGMKSIAALPNGILTGKVKVLGFDPATGVVSWEGDPDSIGTNHLAVIMGGFEIMMEMFEMVDVPEFKEAWLDHARKYHTMDGFRVSRLNGYAAWKDHDVEFARQTWDQLLRGIERPAGPNTNGAATWSLDAIYLMEVLPL